MKKNKMCNPSGLEGITSLGIVQNIYRNVPRCYYYCCCCCCCCCWLLLLFLFLSLLAVLIVFVLVSAAAAVVVVTVLLLFLLYIHFLCCIQQEKILLKLIWVLLSLRHDVGFFARWKRQLDTTSLHLCHVRPSASLISWKKSNSLWLDFRGTQQ